MDVHSHGREVLHIKKYPNRRYYDATRSRHVTLHEVHDLILAGTDVSITDSRTGTDITNLVLVQILLEKDEPKLDIFPTSFFHMMIRSNRQVLRGYVEQVFSPLMNLLASSRKHFDQYLRSASGGTLMTPLEWTNRMMELFGQIVPGASPGPSSPPASETGGGDPEWNGEVGDPSARSTADVPNRTDSSSERDGDLQEPLDDLRTQAAELMRKIEKLSQEQAGDQTVRDAES